MQFSLSCGFVGFSRVEVSRRTGVPGAGVDVLEAGALLEKDFSGFVLKKEVNCSMAESCAMHFPSRILTNDLVFLIHHIEEFFGSLGVIFEGVGIQEPGEGYPLLQAELFGTDRGGEVECFPGRFPLLVRHEEAFAELFPALSESSPDERIEKDRIKGGECLGLFPAQVEDGGVDLGARVKAVWTDVLGQADIPARLHAESEDAEILRPRNGDETFRYLALDHDDRFLDGRMRAKKISDDLSSCRIGEIADEAHGLAGVELAGIEVTCVLVHDGHRRAFLESLGEEGGEATVELDEEEVFRTLEEVPRERARSRADFDHEVIRIDGELIGDPIRHISINEEVLAQFAAGMEVNLHEETLEFGKVHVGCSSLTMLSSPPLRFDHC